jgi:hypothetical protein
VDAGDRLGVCGGIIGERQRPGDESAERRRTGATAGVHRDYVVVRILEADADE